MASLVFLWSLLLLSLSLAKTSVGLQLPSAISDHLRTSGYSISASILSAPTHRHHTHRRVSFNKGWNATGTLFLPSDFAFHSHSNSLHQNHHHLDPSQFSVSLLLYHATPSLPLHWSHLISLPSHSTIPLSISIPTFSFRRNHRSCLFLHRPRPSSAYLCLKNSPFYNVEEDEDSSCVPINRPDLYTSRDLVIHGVDGILDHSSAFPCFRLRKRSLHRHLRRGKLSEIANGRIRRRYDNDDELHHHRHRRRRSVGTRRYRLLDLSKLPRGTRMGTTAGRNSTVRIGDDLTVDGEEIFGHGWAVVLSIRDIFPISDDVADQVSDGPDYSDSLGMDGPSDGSDYQGSESPADAPQVPPDVDAADVDYQFP